MRYFLLLFITVIIGCSENEKQKEQVDTEIPVTKEEPAMVEPVQPKDSIIATPGAINKKYSNARFKDVTVTKDGDTYRIKGSAQIFEAAFAWVVEDGHNEIKQGHEMTDAGAPEWGHFNFSVTVKKQNPNSVLHLILFENSAKDGSRQYELPVLLP